MHLVELLAASSPETELVLDLKGPRMQLAKRVLETIQPHLDERRFTVCTRWWRLLDVFAGTPVRRVHSVGSARQLRQMLRRFADQRLEGVSIHERLVDRETIASLREIAELIMAWPVNQPERARALLGLGIDALITDDVSVLSRSGVLGATT